MNYTAVFGLTGPDALAVQGPVAHTGVRNSLIPWIKNWGPFAVLELQTVARGAYFQLVAEVMAGGVNVSYWLLAVGLVRGYSGVTKREWGGVTEGKGDNA